MIYNSLIDTDILGKRKSEISQQEYRGFDVHSSNTELQETRESYAIKQGSCLTAFITQIT